MGKCIYLRVSFEVSLVKRLEVALVRACGRGLASWWDKVGEVGGAEYTGGPRSLSCPPWKVLRIVEPRVRRHLSEEEEEEAAPAPEMLSVDGDAAGMRWPRELQDREGRGIYFQWAKPSALLWFWAQSFIVLVVVMPLLADGYTFKCK